MNTLARLLVVALFSICFGFAHAEESIHLWYQGGSFSRTGMSGDVEWLEWKTQEKVWYKYKEQNSYSPYTLFDSERNITVTIDLGQKRILVNGNHMYDITSSVRGPELPKKGEFYSIIARHSGKAIAVPPGNTENNTPFAQSRKAFGKPEQSFTFEYAGYNRYFIILKQGDGNKALTVEGGSIQQGARVVQSDLVRSNEQEFILHPHPGFFVVYSDDYVQALSISGGEQQTQDGAALIVWPYENRKHEQWTLAQYDRPSYSLREAASPED